MSEKLNIGIVGSGIQGISNALFLQKKGFNVTIFDRDEPGSPAASYGNAGHFSPYASLSLNRTDVLADVPAMLLSSTGPLALKWNYVPKMVPWFFKFILNTTKNKMMHTAKNMHQILDLALPAYDELFDEIQLEGLVENKGINFSIRENYHVPMFFILDQGSLISRLSPCCSNSIEILSGDFINAILPSLGGLLIVTPESINF